MMIEYCVGADVFTINCQGRTEKKFLHLHDS